MKGPLLFLFALSLLCSVEGYSQKDTLANKPLIKNSDMEQVPGTDWNFVVHNSKTPNPNDYKFSHSTEAAASGTHSIKLNCATIKDTLANCFVYQSFSSAPIPVGAKVTLKAKVKTADVKGKGVTVTLRGDKIIDGRGNAVLFISTDGKTPITGTSDFKEYSIVLDKYTGNTDYMAVILSYLPGTTGTAYFDDVTLVIN
ncbi:hypothetical protein GCM10027341_03540 [Spirosoma knui]